MEFISVPLAPMTFLDGNRIRLRGFHRDDLPAYRRWLETADVTYFLEMGATPVSDRELEVAYVQSAETPDNVVFAIERKDTGATVGTAGIWAISWICRRGDFRIIIGEPDAFGLGFGTEAAIMLVDYGFQRLNLETITLGFNAENARARRAYEKAGFVYEGRRRQLIYRNGRYYDVDYMSVLRKEYEARRFDG